MIGQILLINSQNLTEKLVIPKQGAKLGQATKLHQIWTLITVVLVVKK